jgi:hypothetical protein
MTEAKQLANLQAAERADAARQPAKSPALFCPRCGYTAHRMFGIMANYQTVATERHCIRCRHEWTIWRTDAMRLAHEKALSTPYESRTP